MPTEIVPPIAINEFIEAYESARLRFGSLDLREFLPPRAHPLYATALRELVRVDLEYGWEAGRPISLEDYRQQFPELFQDAAALEEIAFEEYRQRLRKGQGPRPEEYQERYGIAIDAWAALDGERPSRQFQRTVVLPSDASPAEGDAPADANNDPESAPSCEQADVLAALPEVGTEFLGFQLLEELGRGTFGRVYLAQQGSLADRRVALKVSAELYAESQTLAQLQHTNIVPIYSVHRCGPLQAVCMPYFGSTTLATIFHDLKNRPSLPASGKHFVSTLEGRRSTIRPGEPSIVEPLSVPTAGAATTTRAVADPPRIGRFTAALETLEKLTYVEAVLWLGARLADGLAHAHERGILHRDLKPANVLLTDDGQPMLLDFNLSEDTKLNGPRSIRRVGGTLPYMAPEQLAAFNGQLKQPPDGRADIYSLGVLLYELLTGRPSFPLPACSRRELIPHLIEQRRQPAPSLRPWNKAVSLAAETIVRRCLEPDPERRYHSARALLDDLECQLARLPLKHTPEPSPAERVRKWAYRHPRVASATTVAVVAATFLLGLGGVSFHLWQRQQDGEAQARWRQFREDKLATEYRLNAREPDQLQLQDGWQQGLAALQRYQVLEDPEWSAARTVRRLKRPEQEQLGEEVADLLMDLARAAALRAGGRPEDERGPLLAYAFDLNRRAEDCLAADRLSQSLYSQRAELANLLGQPDQARILKEKANALPIRTPRDRFRLALKLRDHGQTLDAEVLLRQAVRQLEESTREDPQDFWAWYLRGNCHDLLAQWPESIACYTVCTVLNPTSYESFCSRGMIYLRQRRWQTARGDLSRAIDLRPDLPAAYVQRALAERESGDYAAAEPDLSRALELGSAETRIFFWRAAVRDKLGHKAGARADRAEGMRREPADEHSWVERGLARLQADPKAALADFEQALRLNRRYLPALQDKAHVLGERLGLTKDAVRIMDQIVAFYPDLAAARLDRGVLLARIGNREAAHQDARTALVRDASAKTFYQVANIYALTSRQQPADAEQVFPFLNRALQNGFGLDIIETDHDLDPIRALPGFRNVIQAARHLPDK